MGKAGSGNASYKTHDIASRRRPYFNARAARGMEVRRAIITRAVAHKKRTGDAVTSPQLCSLSTVKVSAPTQQISMNEFFSAIDGTKPYKFIGSGAIDVTKGVRRPIEFVRIPRIDRSRILGPTGGVAEPL